MSGMCEDIYAEKAPWPFFGPIFVRKATALERSLLGLPAEGVVNMAAENVKAGEVSPGPEYGSWAHIDSLSSRAVAAERRAKDAERALGDAAANLEMSRATVLRLRAEETRLLERVANAERRLAMAREALAIL